MSSRFQNIIDALAELDDEAFLEGVNAAVADGEKPQDIVNACAAGVEKVGELFEEGEYFVGELVYTSDILSKAMDILEPLLGNGGGNVIGSMVIGTVQGDLHDIGKNIFISMMKSVGFKIYDLGVDVSPEAFVEKIKEVNPDIVGMSGLLTLSVDMMKTIIDTIEAAGLHSMKIMIGGNIVNDMAMEHTGADAWSTNASKGVKQCKAWVEENA